MFDSAPPDILKKEGLCANTGETDKFYPGDGESFQKAMVQFCAYCPVRKECAQWAIDEVEYGLWGGLSEEDRKMIRRHSPGGKKGPYPWPEGLEHGSKKASFRAHLQMGELPCDVCHETWCSRYPRIVMNLKPKTSALNGSHADD